MLNVRNVIRSFVGLAGALVITLAPVASIAAGSSIKSDRKLTSRERVIEPVNLAILIQDDLVSRVSNELRITGDFIKSLPRGSQVMVGYITTGRLQVRQPFTSDLAKAAGSLRILVSSNTSSAFNPYVEVLEALRKFEPETKNRNILLLISDGLDDSRGFDPASVLNSIDLNRAISEAKERDVTIFSFYAPSVGLTSRNRLAASYGQGSLNRVSRETGGKAFFQGTDFVTFNSYFEEFTRALNRLESAD